MKIEGPWSRDQIQQFLHDTHVPVRVAGNGGSGHPVLAALWFVSLEGQLWCATQRTARIAELITNDPRCAFEVSLESPPYRGVRGRAMATIHQDRGEEILQMLLDRYVGESMPRLSQMLLSKVDQEVAIRLEPQTLLSWDYRDRMVQQR